MAGGGRSRRIEAWLHTIVCAMQYAMDAEESASRRGLLQTLDARCKLVAILALIVAAELARSLVMVAGLFGLAVLLALASRIALRRLARQVWVAVLVFTGVIALPSLVLVPGDTLWQLPYGHWCVTVQGLRSAAFLVGRGETCATLAVLLVLTTPWMHVLKALRCLGVPVALVAILGMTQRYIFVLLEVAAAMFEARRSRMLAPLPASQARAMVTASLGVLLEKSFRLATDVHLAMVARGYRGEVYMLHDFHARWHDWLALTVALAVPVATGWLQR